MATNPNDPEFPDRLEKVADTPQLATKEWFIAHGLTKREEFAKAAMMGLIANVDIIAGMAKAGQADMVLVAKGIANMAVAHADALIAELNKEVK